MTPYNYENKKKNHIYNLIQYNLANNGNSRYRFGFESALNLILFLYIKSKYLKYLLILHKCNHYANKNNLYLFHFLL